MYSDVRIIESSDESWLMSVGLDSRSSIWLVLETLLYSSDVEDIPSHINGYILWLLDP